MSAEMDRQAAVRAAMAIAPADAQLAQDLLNDPPTLLSRERGIYTREGCGRPFAEHDYGTFCP